MLLVGGLWGLCLVAWMVYKLFQQVADIRSFADPAALPVAAAQPTAEQIVALQQKMQTYTAAVKAQQKASLSLTVDDLNGLLASYEGIQSVKEIIRVDRITANEVRFQTALQLNGIPFSKEKFFLNGYVTTSPLRQPDFGYVLQTKDMELPNKKVSEGFLNEYRRANQVDALLFDKLRSRNPDPLSDVLKATTTCRTEDNLLTLEFVPTASPAAARK